MSGLKPNEPLAGAAKIYGAVEEAERIVEDMEQDAATGKAGAVDADPLLPAMVKTVADGVERLLGIQVALKFFIAVFVAAWCALLGMEIAVVIKVFRGTNTTAL